MTTFDEFYASLDPDIGIRGKQFEKFVKWFLKTDPTWASQIDEVWLWNEYPKRWGPDCGIDLIFTHKKGVNVRTLDKRLDTTIISKEIVGLIVSILGYAAEQLSLIHI